MRRDLRAPAWSPAPSAGRSRPSHTASFTGDGPAAAVRRHLGAARTALAALCAVAALLVLTTSASAALVSQGTFDGTGTPARAMSATWLSVDQSTGDVYAIDSAHDVVNVFDARGTYLRQLTGSSTTARSFSFGGDDDVAVDNSGGANAGNVYVSSENSGHVFAFDASGAFLWQTTAGITDVCGVSVDPSGNPWLGDFNQGLKQLSPADGSLVGSPILATGDSCHHDWDSSGNIVLAHWNNRIEKFDSGGTSLLVYSPTESNRDVAVDHSNDDVYAVAFNQIRHWNAAGDMTDTFASSANAVAVDYATTTVYVSQGASVEIWAPLLHTLTVNKDGTGTGGVTSDVGGIDCGATCSAQIDDGTTVTLSPAADTGSQFVTWTGCDSVVGDLCTVRMTADTTVTATFDLIPQHTLTVTKDGTGSGTVTSDVGGIDCGLTCDALFNEGDSVTLSASAATGSTFTGWSGGGCSGTADCVVSVNADTTVTATFAQNAPTVVTGAASSITQTGATVAGTVNPNGGNVTACHVDYGTTASYGSQVACASLPGSGTSAAAVSAALSGLTAGTTYHYRVVATNAGGTTNGSDATFTTTAATPPVRTCATDPSLCPRTTPGVLSLVARTAAVSSGKAAIKLACTGDTACTGKITLTAKVKVRKGKRTVTKSRKIGTATVNIAANGRATVKVKLSKAARSLLAKRHSLKATLAGPDLRTTVVLKQPAKKHKKK